MNTAQNSGIAVLPKQGQIRSELIVLDNNLGELSDSLVRLEERISPILDNNAGMSKDETPISGRGASLCDMGMELNAYNSRLYELVRLLNRIIDRVEL